MGKIYLFFVVDYLFLTSLTTVLYAQWQPDVQLTNNPANSSTSGNNARCIAANGSNVYAVWYDERDGNYEIYFKSSIDSGITWGADIRLTNNDSSSAYPSISVSGSAIHVVWYDERDGNFEIYYKRSTDAGITWGPDIRLTNNTALSDSPSISVSGPVVNIVWYDLRDGNEEIYYKRSIDGGLSWGTDVRLTNNTADSRNSSVSASGVFVHVLWQERRDGNWEIYYKRSTNFGANWTADTRLTNAILSSSYVSSAVSGPVVHVTWHDTRDGNSEIYYKRSTDSGVNWGPDKLLIINDDEQELPSIASSGSNVHIAWRDNRDGNLEAYYCRSTDDGQSWMAVTRLTHNSAVSYNPFVAASGTAVHVVWADDRTGNWEIHYKRNPTGNPIGLKPISTEIPETFKLYQNYPNPFNPATTFTFSIPKSKMVGLVVYDIIGSEVSVILNERINTGIYSVSFDASSLASGTYFYKLTTDEFSDVKKMILLK